MSAKNCAIPGCSFSRNRSSEARSLFTIRRPDLIKNPVIKGQHEAIVNMILSLRDYDKGDCIKELLHKESAAICEDHFEEGDVIRHKARKTLRPGALPKKNLPLKSVRNKEQRKPPAARAELPGKVRHKTFDDVCKSLTKLSQNTKGEWSACKRQNKLFLEKFVDEDQVIPEIRVILSTCLDIESVALHGWKFSLSHLTCNNLRLVTLHEFLGELERVELCGGVTDETRNIREHIVLSWNIDRLLTKARLLRSPRCQVVVWQKDYACEVCRKYDIHTMFNKKYSSKNHIPQVNDETSITVQEELHMDIMELFKTESAEMNEWQRMFFSEQCDNAKKHPNNRRYHPDVVRWAIELYARSPSAYDMLRTTGVLTLPSSGTLQKYRNFSSSNAGICQVTLEQLKSLNETIHAFITIDEMKVRENLVYRNGRILGFVDYGNRDAPEDMATHICMFYLRSFDRKLSAPFSWWPTTATPAYQLASMFYEAVTICERYGVRIHAVVADGAATNRKFFSIIHGSISNPNYHNFTAPHPTRKKEPIFLCSDTSHLLKTARNSLYASKPGGTKFFCKDKKHILWTHVKELYECSRKRRLHLPHKITQTHIELDPYRKMKVSLAKDVLSYNAAMCMQYHIPNSEGTVEFIRKFDKWFNIVTCHAVSSVSDERLTWLQDVFIKYLEDWKREVEDEHTGENKRLLAKPTLNGLLFTTRNMIRLTIRLLNNGMKYVALKILTQDVLEATFGSLRAAGRYSRNPDVDQVGFSITSVCQRKAIKRIKGTNTTSMHGSQNPWEEICDEPLTKSAKHP